MKIIDRYIGKEFVFGFLLAVFGLTLMFMSMTVLETLGMESNQSKDYLYKYYLYMIPQTIVFVIPAAMMFSVCFIVAQFSNAREMVACFSAGISFYRVIMPILIFAMLVSLMIVPFQNYIVTPSNRAASENMNQYRKNTRTMENVVWQTNLKGKEGYYFVYFFDREKDRIIGGFHIMEMNGKVPRRMLQARQAYYNEDGSWTLKLVKDVHFRDDLTVEKTDLKPEMNITLPEDKNFFANPMRDPNELSFGELIDEIEFRESNGFTAVPYRVQVHASLSFPFMCFIVALVGAIAGNMGSLRSGGPLIRALLLSTATIFFYQLAFRIGQNLGETGILPPFAAGWGPTGFFALAAVYLIHKNRK